MNRELQHGNWFRQGHVWLWYYCSPSSALCLNWLMPPDSTFCAMWGNVPLLTWSRILSVWDFLSPKISFINDPEFRGPNQNLQRSRSRSKCYSSISFCSWLSYRHLSSYREIQCITLIFHFLLQSFYLSAFTFMVGQFLVWILSSIKTA